MLELHTRQVYTVDATAIQRARKNEKEQRRGDKAEVPPWDGQQCEQTLRYIYVFNFLFRFGAVDNWYCKVSHFDNESDLMPNSP